MTLTRRRTRAELSLEVHPQAVVTGEHCVASLTVANTGRHYLPGLRVEVPIGSAVAIVMTPGLSPGEEFYEDLSVPTGEAGFITVGPARFASRFGRFLLVAPRITSERVTVQVDLPRSRSGADLALPSAAITLEDFRVVGLGLRRRVPRSSRLLAPGSDQVLDARALVDSKNDKSEVRARSGR